MTEAIRALLTRILLNQVLEAIGKECCADTLAAVRALFRAYALASKQLED